MIGRLATFTLATAIAAFSPIGAAVASTDDGSEPSFVLRKEQDDDEVATRVDPRDDDDDDDDDSDDGFTSGVNSGDRTNSRHSAVSRNGDRSRGDLTRDRTKDGPGASTRDRSAHHTNDRSRNDTR